jgi:hypothetical protein
MLDVRRELIRFVAGLSRAERKARGTRRGTRVLSCWVQAVFVIALFRDKPNITRHGAAFRLSQSTACRYLHEGIEVLADPGYQGAGLGVIVPFAQPADGNVLAVDNRCHNRLQRFLRCRGERGFALLTERSTALKHTTLSPSRIGDLIRAAHVLTLFEHRRIH